VIFLSQIVIISVNNRVKLAIDKETKNKVAIKIMRESCITDEASID
jgi:hypothetical protein